MARTREFEPQEALDAAMHVFWEKGFAETSYGDLVSRTGVSRKGLYTVFGDKDALFLEALKHYRQKLVPRLFSVLAKEEITMGDIRKMFLHFAEMAASGEGEKGCFMANTASAEKIFDPEVKQLYDAHISDLSNSFRNAFMRFGLKEQHSVELGDYCTGVLQGLFLLAHARADGLLIRNFVDVSLKELKT